MQSKSEANDLLDQDGPETVRMSVAEAMQMGVTAFQRLRYTAEEARIITSHLIDCALCGYMPYGLPRILHIAEDEKTGKVRTPVKVIHETPFSALMDGGNNVGYLAVYHAAQTALAKVRTSGLAVVGMHNSFFSGRNSFHVEEIVKAGYVAIHTSSAPVRALPPGGKSPAVGTNPICFGFPSDNGPVIVDMGTSSIMWGDIILHAFMKTPVPEGTCFDSEGLPTRDAEEALKGGMGTFGGHKGFGIALAVQALGLLAGAPMTRGNIRDYGFLFLAVDPEVMFPGGRKTFSTQMAELIRQIKATPLQPGVDEIRIPSERSFRERERRLKEGILLERKVVEAIKAL